MCIYTHTIKELSQKTIQESKSSNVELVFILKQQLYNFKLSLWINLFNFSKKFFFRVLFKLVALLSAHSFTSRSLFVVLFI